MIRSGWWSLATTAATNIIFFLHPSSAASSGGSGLTLVTGVAATANSWDTRDSSGCLPGGCVAKNVLDDSIAPASRWSCSESLTRNRGACWLTLQFDTPEDIVQMNMALHRGDERIRSVDVWVDNVFVAVFKSSGTTLDYEAYELIVPQASTIVLQAVDIADNGWISITEVQFFSGDVTSPSAAPTPAIYSPSTSGMSTTTSMAAAYCVPDATDCPDGSIPNSLDISLEFEGHLLALRLFVVEPGQETPVGFQSSGGEVGSITSVSGDFLQTGPQSITYLLLNGLNVEEDQVLGDYTVFMGTSGGVWGAEGIPYTLTTRTNGMVLWTVEGVSPPPDENSESYVATVTEYIDSSNCTLKRYGECWTTFSPTGNPPCERCPEGLRTSNRGATYCTVRTLSGAGLPEVVNDAILEEAVYGFPGSRRVTFDQGDVSLPVNLGEEDEEVTLSGQLLGLFEPTPIPPSTGLFSYVYGIRDDPVTAFVRGEGCLDTSTGRFSVAISVPDGPSRVFLIFILQNATDATSTDFDAPQADLYVLRNECDKSYLTITLETDVEDSFIDMGVFEPDSGTRPVFEMGSVGYIAREEPFGRGSETYKLYNKLDVKENPVLGDYRVRIFDEFIEVDTPYKLTFRVAGEIERVEEGVFPADGSVVEFPAFTIDSYESYEDC